MFRKLFNYQVSSNSLDRRFGPLFFFAATPVMLVLTVRKLAALQLAEGEFFIGLLAAVAVSLLMLVIGLLLKPRDSAQK